MRIIKNLLLTTNLVLTLFSYSYAETSNNISWERELTAQTFARAKAGNKLILLNLEAVWCHWCHVMEHETYSNPEVISEINAGYIPVKIDQDSRPDLSNRYRDYGWPATIIISPAGEDLKKMSGYVEKVEFAKILNQLHVNPQQTDSAQNIKYSESSNLGSELKAELIARYKRLIDPKLGGLKTTHKYLDYDTIEYALMLAIDGDESQKKFAQTSLNYNVALLDPVWGGVYQYSTHGNWGNPHFEKIASKQAENIKLYSLAYSAWKRPEYADFIRRVVAYLETFLSDESGGFYVSQDADLVQGKHSEDYFRLRDSERRAKGIPRVDKNMYANENGRLISALASAYAATGDASYLSRAERSAKWLAEKRRSSSGGFVHGDKDTDAVFLTDSLFTAQGFLDLYAVTANRNHLNSANLAAKFITEKFLASDGAGFITSTETYGVLKPARLVSENIAVARLLVSLSQYTGNLAQLDSARAAMRYLATKEVALDSSTEIGIVLADIALNRPPLHVTVVGSKTSGESASLFKAALAYPAVFKRTEWWDKAEGQMPNPAVQYPTLSKPAAFVCTERRCSLPLFTPEKLVETINRIKEQL